MDKGQVHIRTVEQGEYRRHSLVLTQTALISYYIDEYGQSVFTDGYDDYGRRYASQYERPIEQYGYTHPYRSPSTENDTTENWQ